MSFKNYNEIVLKTKHLKIINKHQKRRKENSKPERKEYTGNTQDITSTRITADNTTKSTKQYQEVAFT